MQHDDAQLVNTMSNPTWFLLAEGLVDIAHLFFTRLKTHGLIEGCSMMELLGKP